MSKKSKKQSRKTNASTTRSVQNSNATVSAAPAVSNFNAVRAVEKEFNPDYSPVIKDLKRIGSLASVFIAILVALSFFLR